MDTNQNVANNYQINTFTKGMNSDTSYDMVGADQYLFGQNIRITNNTLLLGDLDANNTEMVVAPVPEGDTLSTATGSDVITNVDKILAADAIGNVGVIIVKIKHDAEQYPDCWSVYKVEKKAVTDTIEAQQVTSIKLEVTHIYTSSSTTSKDRFSITMIREIEGVLKVYIADGKGSPICLFLDGGEKNIVGINEDALRSLSYFPKSKPKLQKRRGNLLTQQVQYAYRFYTRYAYTSKLSPFTNKIQVINDNRDVEQGNAENTQTTVGFNIFIKKPEIDIFDHVQVFRISYIKYQETPDIYLIYDKPFDYTNSFEQNQFFDNGYYLIVHDDGSTTLQQYSIDEFSSLTSQTIIPQILESNQNYLFCGDIKDNTIIEEEHISGITTSISKAIGSVKINEETGGKIPKVTTERDVTYSSSSDYRISKNVSSYQSIGQYLKDCGIYYIDEDGSTSKCTYNDLFVSSLLRSCRTDEKYYYGIVYYDSKGRRSNVIPIGMNNQSGDLYDTDVVWDLNDNRIENPDVSKALGINVTISGFADSDIVGFEIVRQEKNFNTTKNLLQVALSRPMRQGKYSKTYDQYHTPYYPNVFLTTQFVYSMFGYTNTNELNSQAYITEDDLQKVDLWNQYFDHNGQNVDNFTLYQIFSPGINVLRSFYKNLLQSSNNYLQPVTYLSENESLINSQAMHDISESTTGFGTSYVLLFPIAYANSHNFGTLDFSSALNSIEGIHKTTDGIYAIDNLNFKRHNKPTSCAVVSLTQSASDIDDYNLTSVKIKNVADVKNPNWENGFSNVQLQSSTDLTVTSAIKQYKTYSTTIGEFEYNNWASNGMYDLAVSENEASSQLGNTGAYSDVDNQKSWVFHLESYDPGRQNKGFRGWIGPGPVCLLINTEMPESSNILCKQYYYCEEDNGELHLKMPLGTLICNITHQAQKYSKNDPYFGFGNYFELPTDGTDTFSCYVFDGDVYKNYAEFVNLFKAYDFNDRKRTLDSGQLVYYIPLESEINVCFDYGYNYRNTNSKNLLLEPGKINGVTTQDRPLHQYNRVYSDNNFSINRFYVKSEDEEVLEYPQRICYSQLKTNGEHIDSWQIFKPADFIDTDSRYGKVTNLLSKDSNIYFWQTGAFGKLSVNERSIVTDDNGETIQLGQGGVLQRADYLSTKYGMREQDMCSVNTEDSIYWIDILNKAILMCKQNQVVNYGEALNVQNYINASILLNEPSSQVQANRRPTINYDLQTNELLCQAFNPSTMDQLIFNTKLGIAQSVYTRKYNDVLLFNNVLVGAKIANGSVTFIQLNHLQKNNSRNYLSNTVLKFVVNSSASQTKVFDSQKVVTLGKSWEELNQSDINNLMPNYLKKEQSAFLTSYFTNKTYDFKTDIKHSSLDPMYKTDREGNIVYDIPRAEKNSTTQFDPTKGYGDRMRGKWMVETITDTNPQPDYCISHIITKFRQSYS